MLLRTHANEPCLGVRATEARNRSPLLDEAGTLSYACSTERTLARAPGPPERDGGMRGLWPERQPAGPSQEPPAYSAHTYRRLPPQNPSLTVICTANVDNLLINGQAKRCPRRKSPSSYAEVLPF
jgi:hypothetical protein